MSQFFFITTEFQSVPVSASDFVSAQALAILESAKGGFSSLMTDSNPFVQRLRKAAECWARHAFEHGYRIKRLKKA